MNANAHRRSFIGRLLALVALPYAAPRLACAQAGSPSSVDALVRALTGGAPPRQGRIKIEVPQLADNGNSVSLKVSVDSRMTEAEFVRSIHLYAEKNPRPAIASFYLGPQTGRAQVSTRIRLAGTQRVLAVAALSDGSFWSDSAEVVVTGSACGDES